jgi:hypothetical protein
MQRPTVLAAIDRMTTYHATDRRRYAKKAERTTEPHLRAYYTGLASYHEGALDTLAELRRVAPTRARTTYR